MKIPIIFHYKKQRTCTADSLFFNIIILLTEGVAINVHLDIYKCVVL